jgi:hypothetical protein
MYEVSSLGNIRSVSRFLRFKSKNGNWFMRRAKTRSLAKNMMNAGYHIVHLYRGDRRTVKTVHSVVAAAFIGPRPEKHDVAHGNGDRLDNRAENLRYATRSENHFDKRRHGTSRLGKKRGE